VISFEAGTGAVPNKNGGKSGVWGGYPSPDN